MHPSPYTIYSASAGSGKTSTLVKEYLKIVLGSAHSGKFYQILAITFTNKAVNEMKGRILDSLTVFSRSEHPEAFSHMFTDICSELKISPVELKERSAKTLKELLHNYAFFDVSTIDKFTHRLIRTFAKDLKLPQNFEVILDTDLFLEEAIARLLAKAGEDPELTRVLIDFSLEKIDDDRSWDIAFDLFKIGRLLFNENHLAHINRLEGKNLAAFSKLKEQLRYSIKECESRMREHALGILQSMHSNNLEQADFSNGYLPKFMTLIHEGHFNKVNFDAGWKQNFGQTVPYNKTCDPDIRIRIDALLPAWRFAFNELKESYNTRALLHNAYRNLVPLTILSAIQAEVRGLQKERDQLPISAFNSLISKEINNQPAPFIYERLGEKYRHYFIDEFQDTSTMQWGNLIPLIANALEAMDTTGARGSLLLVGDAKQAIYRWRGGQAEQFMNLINREANPFTISPSVEWKPSNYRSTTEIVRFNNDLFTHLSTFLQNDTYRELYLKGSQQKTSKKEGGMVQLHFISPGERSRDELYCEAVLRHIQEARALEYPYSDLCILTRTRAQGVRIADYLTGQGIPIISSETLLLKNHPTVLFLIALLKYCQTPMDKNAVFEVLYFLSTEGERHRFIAAHLDSPEKMLKECFGFDPNYINHLPVFDALEYAIKSFSLAANSDAYLTFLLEEALVVEQKEDSSIPAFLENWEKHKDSLSIVAPEAMNAVRIMTIHKAKGLEFPIVIYPYANTDVQGSRRDKDAFLWLSVEAALYAGFDELLLSKRKEMTSYNASAEELYNQEQQKLQLDAFNLLYVALTRAEKGLYILTEKDLDAKGKPKNHLYSGLFINYLMSKGLWEDEQLLYTFGKLSGKKVAALPQNSGISIPYQYSYKNRPEFRLLTKSGMLWDTDRGEALTKGIRIHELMAMVKTQADLPPALDQLRMKGDLSTSVSADLGQLAKRIMNHPDLVPYYKEGQIIRNEVEILTEKGKILRPDRIVTNGKKATIIDYKTGRTNPRYGEQLYDYAEALEAMGFEVENRIIVYIDEEVNTEFI